MKRVLVRSPSNIALVKYMGKRPGQANLPENPSVSLTLDSLCTVVELILESSAELHFQLKKSFRCDSEFEGGVVPAKGLTWVDPILGDQDWTKIQDFVDRMLKGRIQSLLIEFGLSIENVELRRYLARNTFPAGAGIASSASFYSALTVALAQALTASPQNFRDLFEKSIELRTALARLSREGSGSSCRSLLGPWTLWNEDSIYSISSGAALPQVSDLVLVVSAGQKKVSSSLAHQRVKSSPLWEGRVERASTRAQRVAKAIQAGDWNSIADEVWQESWEMHSLFHTAVPPFTYWQPQTVELLNWLESQFSTSPLRPWVTLDAGPNVHLIVPRSDEQSWMDRLRDSFPDLTILCDHQSSGTEVLS